MEPKKHKRKKNHVIIITSDDVDANVKQFQVRQWLVQLLIIVVCVIIGAVIGYFLYEGKIWEVTSSRTEAQQTKISQLEEDKAALEKELSELKATYEQEVESLNNKLTAMCEAVNQKTSDVNELQAQIESQSTPDGYPLTGQAQLENSQGTDHIAVFSASAGTTVVATAAGTVSAINDDSEYGHNVWIDHGNGYITIYRNQGDPNVKLGDTVAQGTTLFIIGEKNTKFGYQIMKDGAYIDPMEMMSING